MPGEPRSTWSGARVLSGEEQRQVPTTSRVGSLTIGVPGSSDGWSTMLPWRPDEALVRDHRAVDDGRITITSKVMVATLRRVADASAGIDARRRIGRRVDQHAARRAADRPATSATGAPFSVVLPGDVGRVRRDRVAQHHVHGILVADVLDRDRVAQRLAGEQDARVAGQVGRDLLHPEGRRDDDRHPRRILVARDEGIGRGR